jgi:hypothetical protein
VETIALVGTLPADWLKYKNSEHNLARQHTSAKRKRERVSEQFWRTMVAGKGPDGKNPPLSYHLVCQELFEDSDDITLQLVKERTKNNVLLEFTNRILAVIWGKRLTETSKHNCLALVPKQTKKGDKICILYGCSVPLVLRKMAVDTMEGEDRWVLIGECYMYGMMFGDALIERRSGRSDEEKEFYKQRTFKIR